MNLIKINLQRLEYLVELYGFTKEEFTKKLNNFYKKEVKQKDIFSGELRLNYLKKLDQEFFKKSLSFYTDPNNITNKKNRIFFRKNSFNSRLEFGDRQIIAKLEDEISYLNGLKVLAREKEKGREFDTYNQEDDPKQAAQNIKEKLYPQEKITEDRDFLKALISKFAENNIFVFEFVEQWNKKEKSNFNGCFISPNNIIIKRQQGSFKREIFTLAHELGHYLLNNEELDEIDFSIKDNKSAIERWCDKFAFAFLIGDGSISRKVEDFKSNPSIDKLNFLNDFHISRLAFLTHLADNKKISWDKYFELKKNIDNQYKKIERDKKKQNELNKAQGMLPLEIISPLKDRIYKSAYFEGVIGEAEVREKLKLKRRKKDFEDFLYEQNFN